MKSRKMLWEGHVAGRRELINEYNIFIRRPERKRLPCSHRLRLEDNIKMNI
jgi:hypothetical protein